PDHGQRTRHCQACGPYPPTHRVPAYPSEQAGRATQLPMIERDGIDGLGHELMAGGHWRFDPDVQKV
ncbi:hypothetical protein, partial [Xanthomonas hortorum]|uniref:hypothetical protein n=1 Tax=Xanthomonas hortorum TaxID=56454 RepID=UPI001E28322C